MSTKRHHESSLFQWNSGNLIKWAIILGILIWFLGTFSLYTENYKHFYQLLNERIPKLTFILHGALFLLFSSLSIIIWYHYEKSRKISLELENSENRFKFLLNSINDAVWIQDAGSGQILFQNPQALEFRTVYGQADLQKNSQELSGTELDKWLEELPTDDRERVSRVLQDKRSDGGVNCVFRRSRPDGSIAHYLLRKNALVSGNNEKTELYSIFITDISRLKESEEEVQNLSRSLISAQENERRRIARDLHDHVAQGLASIKLQLEALEHRMGSPEIHALSLSAKDLLQDVRALSTGLHPPELDQLGLLMAIREMAETFRDETGIVLDFQAAAMKDVRLPEAMEINIYRVVQEALNNIRKHAQAKTVQLKLVKQGSRITIRIDDDGRGFDPETVKPFSLSNQHMGLRSMEERCHILGAEMNLRSQAAKGTKIAMVIPYVKRAETAAAEDSV